MRRTSLVLALALLLTEAKAKLGPDPGTWRWGRLHTATFRHPLETDDERRAVFGLPPVERGGDGNTLNVGVGPDFKDAHRASFREILDTGDWDRSVATNAPGQSGQPESPHYGDLLPLWAEGRYFPLLFSREKIEGAGVERLVLEPLR
jgi:penicillin amidase